jgi:hypothetical protein
MQRLPDEAMVGQRFGRLTVVSLFARAPTRWTCRCECGVTTHPRQESLRSGHTKSCGCARGLTTHGMTEHELYRTWAHIKERCFCPTSVDFPRYGGRGISMCSRWRGSIVAFVDDMGARPSPKHSIDRIDNDGDYEPGNCRWSTATEQARNRRSSHMLSHNGRTMTITEWELEMGLPRRVICGRINRQGWTPAQAITTPHKTRRTA